MKVDANNVVQVEDEVGEENEPEIRKRLREQRIQKKKAAMAAALQQKRDKEMEEAMARAEVRIDSSASLCCCVIDRVSYDSDLGLGLLKPKYLHKT